MIKKVMKIIIFIITLILVLFFVRSGPEYQSGIKDDLGSPFEATNSTSRYAYLISLLEDKSFFLKDELAEASAPDITYYNGNYFSIFTPGVSLLAIPFYLIGKQLGVPQFGAYFINIIFLLLNGILIYSFASRFTKENTHKLFSAFVFMFGTNALAYSQTLTQHLISSTIILGLLLLLTRSNLRWFNYLLVGLLLGVGLLVDIPNVIISVPLIIFIFIQLFYKTCTSFGDYFIKFRNLILIGVISVPLLLLLLYFNYMQTGSLFKLGQTIGRSNYPYVASTLSTDDQSSLDKEFNPNVPFYTRNQMRNLYLLTISNERGFLYYSPVVLFGIFGLYFALRSRKNLNLSILSFSVIVSTLVLYSTHGDPWGGWAFASRYMIGANAIFCAFIPVALEKIKKAKVLTFIFILILTSYSLIISIAGVLTTNSIPPKIEAKSLIVYVPYTYEYNFQLLQDDTTGNYLYNSYLRNKMPLYSYGIALSGLFIIISTFLLYWPVIRDFINRRKI